MTISYESLLALSHHNAEISGKDVSANASPIMTVLDKIKNSPAQRKALTKFMYWYADWNATFASGVTALSSRIGVEVDAFPDKEVAGMLNDRSLLIASYIFDAARDEYDDSIQKHRDPHRSLAQATVISLADLTNNQDIIRSEIPQDIKLFRRRVIDGYTGETAFSSLNDDKRRLSKIFFGIGYHLGSEMLADGEFSDIDTFMRSEFSDLTNRLMRMTVELHGATHRCYAWIGIHSGHGNGVEMDHFAQAVVAANTALDYLDESVLSKDEAKRTIKAGFTAFSRDQESLFAKIASAL